MYSFILKFHKYISLYFIDTLSISFVMIFGFAIKNPAKTDFTSFFSGHSRTRLQIFRSYLRSFYNHSYVTELFVMDVSWNKIIS